MSKWPYTPELEDPDLDGSAEGKREVPGRVALGLVDPVEPGRRLGERLPPAEKIDT